MTTLNHALEEIERAAQLLVAAYDAGAEDGRHPGTVEWEDLDEAEQVARAALEAIDRLRDSRDPPIAPHSAPDAPITAREALWENVDGIAPPSASIPPDRVELTQDEKGAPYLSRQDLFPRNRPQGQE